jgi:hypothetical protein
MRRRRILTNLLLGAFLIGAWSNVIAAAFCPRYAARDGSVKQTVEQAQASQAESEPCHHEMSDMDMDMGETSMHDMQMEDDSTRQTEITTTSKNSWTADTENPAAALVVLELPNEPCGHCWMHSQPSSGSSTVVALRPSSHSVDVNAPPADSAVTTPFAFTIPITPVEHGPPGNSLPRHVLINVFRI